MLSLLGSTNSNSYYVVHVESKALAFLLVPPVLIKQLSKGRDLLPQASENRIGFSSEKYPGFSSLYHYQLSFLNVIFFNITCDA